METVSSLKKQVEDKMSVIFKECNLFFAFSDKQFEEGSAENPLKEGDKYVRTIGGGILPNSKLPEFNDKMEATIKWYEDQIKENKLEEAEILYELRNHECFYTGDWTDAHAVLSDRYSLDEVTAVYRKHVATEEQF